MNLKQKSKSEVVNTFNMSTGKAFDRDPKTSLEYNREYQQQSRAHDSYLRKVQTITEQGHSPSLPSGAHAKRSKMVADRVS